MKVIINADDFGYSENVNCAIADAFSRGWITNTTIMVNMEGCTQAIQLGTEKGFINKVGLHLNLFEGVPLTDGIKEDPFFSENGNMTSYKFFHQLSKYYMFILPANTVLSLREEIEAQMKRYKELGLTEMHIDSHGHSHTFMSVIREVNKINKEFHFRTMRLSLNMYIKRKLPIRLYKAIYNYRLKKNYRCTDYFTSAAEFIEVAKSMQTKNGEVKWNNKYKDSVCEVMVHPAYDEQGKLINRGSSSFEELMKYMENIELISYSDL